MLCGWVVGPGAGAGCDGSGRGCELTGAGGVAGMGGAELLAGAPVPVPVSAPEGGVMVAGPSVVPPPCGVIGCGGAGGGTETFGWPLSGWSL
ncbi:hypothetical protein FRZ61_25580 [Hypericibacter adhaerens]|uniref:Uncharacterized protein n=1 Tax=Hypericibacter adhaerens TaxID=2602016 RepID=A0A5J6N6R4_9PROT|nr:hypothetical protein FRZ61_25580 [Hypericibacter adhaerens]